MDSPTKETADASRLSVLVIEEGSGGGPRFAEQLRNSKQPVELHTARALDSGLSALDEMEPDVVALDLDLTSGSGVSAVERCKSVVSSIPVVTLTGTDTSEIVPALSEAGAADCLQKEELSPPLVARTVQWAVRERELQKKVEDRDAWTRSIVENISEGVYRSAQGEGLVYANQAFAEMFGYDTVEEILKVDPADLYADPDQRKHLRNVVKRQDAFEATEVEFRRKDGSRFTGLLSGRGVRSEKGELQYYDGAVTDISDRKEAERAFRRSEELHRETLRNITDTVLITKDDGTLTYVCPNVDHIFGWDQQEAEDLGTISALLGGDPFDDNDFDGEQEITNVEWQITDTDGTLRDLLVNIRRVSIQDGTRMYTCREVTERKEWERQLEAVFEQTYQLTGLLEPDGTLIRANKTALQFGGLEEEDVIGQLVWETHWFQTDSEAEERLRTSVRRAADGEFVRSEETVQGAEETRVLDFSLRPIFGENGEVTHIIAEGRDITERIEANRELRETKQLLEKTFESLSEVVLVVDPSGREVITCNAAVEEIFGYERKELIGESTKKLHKSPEAYERFGAIGEPILNEDGIFRHEYEMQRKDGEIIDTEHVVTPLQDENWPGGVVSVIRDVTERKEAEKALQEREAHLRGLANSIPGIIFQAFERPDGSFDSRFVSDRAEDVLGISPEPEGFHSRFAKRIPASHRDEFLASVEAAFQAEEPWRFEIPFERPSGERIWLLGRSTPDRQNGQLLFNGVLLDITDRKEVEETLQEERDRFATLFHNLPTPVVYGRPDDEGKLQIHNVNEPFEAVFGYDQRASRRKDVLDLMVPPTEREYAESLHRRVREGESLSREVQRETADGVRDFRVQVALRGEEGNPTEGFAIYTDITERKERERTLARRKALLEAQAEATIDGLLVVDSDWDVSFYNDRFLDVWDLDEGFTNGERSGASFEPILQDIAADLLQNPETYRETVEHLHEHPDEENRDLLRLTDGRWIDWYSSPIVSDDDTYFGRLSVFRDVTEQRRMQERLLEVQEEERRRIDQEIHDEMGGLLTSLQLTVELARREVEAQDGDTDPIDQVEDLVSELSTTARTISRKLYPGGLSDHGLAGAISSLLHDLETEYGLDVQLHSEIDSTDRFSTLIERTTFWIMQEALVNVARHADTNTAEVVVNTDTERLSLHVSDEGVGFAPSTVGEKKSFGLEGIRRRVERLSGEFKIASVPGEGTRISVTLPLTPSLS